MRDVGFSVYGIAVVVAVVVVGGGGDDNATSLWDC